MTLAVERDVKPQLWPTHTMEGRVKILETYPKYKEIISFYPHIFFHLLAFIVIP